jgi:hypothetical protein
MTHAQTSHQQHDMMSDLTPQQCLAAIQRRQILPKQSEGMKN